MRLPLLFVVFLPLALTGLPDGKDFWWTTLGDSYASGVGSGAYTDGRRCLRYDQAYPVQMQGNNDLGLGTTPQDRRAFQNCVCSGAEVDDAIKYQLLEKDTYHVPSIQYGDRPRFGEPFMATLSIGGDDIDFPGILFNCIIETHIPGGGPPFRTCDEQKTHSWSLIRDQTLVTRISDLIGKIVATARAGQAGNKFKLYVTGYGQFFNNETTLCNDITFARTANPNPDNKPHNNMTTQLRTEFNEMSLGLNAAIKEAVALHAQDGVKYVDIDAILAGHRFCEEGIKEPDQHNPNLWLFHYPYNENDNSVIGTTGPDYTSVLQAANAKVFGVQSISQLSQQYSSARQVDDAFYSAIDWNQVQQLGGGVETTGFWDGVVGPRARLFHPQVPWHTWIQKTIVDQWKSDREIDNTGATPTQSGSSPPPAPTMGAGPVSDKWSYTFHSYTGNLEKGKFSFFVLPGRYNGNYGNSKRSLEGPADAVDELSSNRRYKRSPAARRRASPAQSLDERSSTKESLDRRAIAPPPILPPPRTKTPGKVTVWTQSGSGATEHGPFDLDCTVDEAQWQGFDPKDTGLPLWLLIQSGHTCSFNSADNNLDNLHVKYSAQYQDIPNGVTNNQCVEHDNGVGCNSLTVT